MYVLCEQFIMLTMTIAFVCSLTTNVIAAATTWAMTAATAMATVTVMATATATGMAIATTMVTAKALDFVELVYYNVGVLMTTKLNSPFDLERCGPAVDLALQKVNEDMLRTHHVQLRKVQAR